MKSLPIMTVVAAAGLAVLLASPANAAERKKQRQYVAPNTGWWSNGKNAKASHTVTFSTYVLGTDPDPRIRHGIMQDIGSKFGGGPD
jgi:hypothetical protein